MNNIYNEDQLLQSCSVLFGQELELSRAFLDYLQISGVKSAYRRKVKETHPDLVIGGKADVYRKYLSGFLSLQESYETLCSFLKTREDPVSSCYSATAADPFDIGINGQEQRYSRRHTCKETSFHSDDAVDAEIDTAAWNHACIPSRRLMLGDFLYFAGLASWQDIISALVWQKASRPRMGELACRFGWLKNEDISAIFQARRPGQLFGESAVQCGFLGARQRDSLVFHQKIRQKKIGGYFIEKDLITEHELMRYIKIMKRHNAFHAPII